MYLNGEEIVNDNLKLISSPKIGHEIWVNAREWRQLDTGFRGHIYRVKMYADIVPASELTRGSHSKRSLAHVPGLECLYAAVTLLPSAARSANTSVMAGMFLLILAVACWIWRARITRGMIVDVKAFVRDWYCRARKLATKEGLEYHELRWSSDGDSEVKSSP